MLDNSARITVDVTRARAAIARARAELDEVDRRLARWQDDGGAEPTDPGDESWGAAVAEADRVAAVRAARRAAGDPNEIERWAADQDANDPRRVDPTAASDVHAGAICGRQLYDDDGHLTSSLRCTEPPGHTTGGCLK